MKRPLCLVTIVCATLGATAKAPAQSRFIRGDTDEDSRLSLNDAIRVLDNLFVGTVRLSCRDAADTDDDGAISLNDAILILSCLFVGQPCVAEPRGRCGTDPTADMLDCVSYPACASLDCFDLIDPPPTVEEHYTESAPWQELYGALVCTVQDVSIARNFPEVAGYFPLFSSVAWPGAIVGAMSVTTGMPSPIVVPRAPLTVSILDLGLVDNTREVADPHAGSVDSAINDILRSNIGQTSTPAVISVEYFKAHTRKQMAIDAKVDGLFGFFDAGVGFREVEEKNSIFIKARQHYFTVTVRREASGAEYLAPSASCDRLRAQLPPGDVPAMITSVGYGRLLLFQMTAATRSIESAKLQASFRAKVLKEGTYTQELQEIFETSEKRLLVLGGDPMAAVIFLRTEDVVQFFEQGLYWSVDSPGVPLVYRVNYLTPGMPVFTYGQGTEYRIKDCRINAGDNLFNVWSFGCDRGHNNDFSLNLDGTPVCGSGNCPGAPGSCWGNHRTAGGSDGPGSLDIRSGQDTQLKGDTYLYVSQALNLSLPYDADVGRVWMNGVEVTGNPLHLSLRVGCNHLEWTCYNQNNTPRIKIAAPLASYVERMDSHGCE